MAQGGRKEVEALVVDVPQMDHLEYVLCVVQQIIGHESILKTDGINPMWCMVLPEGVATPHSME